MAEYVSRDGKRYMIKRMRHSVNGGDFDVTLGALSAKVESWRKTYGDDAQLWLDASGNEYHGYDVDGEITYQQEETEEERGQRLVDNKKRRTAAKKGAATRKEKELAELTKLATKHGMMLVAE